MSILIILAVIIMGPMIMVFAGLALTLLFIGLAVMLDDHIHGYKRQL